MTKNFQWKRNTYWNKKINLDQIIIFMFPWEFLEISSAITKKSQNLISNKDKYFLALSK